MASSSTQPTQEAQKIVEELTIDSEPPKEYISIEKVEFKPNNYLWTFQLPAGREFLNEAKEWLLKCPHSLASICATAEVINVKNSKGQLVEKIRLTYTTRN